MKNYFKTIRYDLPASMVVFFVAVPLCLGIALASGAPLFAGIIAGIVGGIVVGVASGSPLGVSGPAAGLAVIVFSAIETLGGSWEAFLMAVVLAGFIQLLMGYAKAGYGMKTHHLVLAEEVSFFNKASVSKVLESIPADSKVIIDCTKSKSISYDVLELIKNYESHAKTKNITIEKMNFIEPGIKPITI